MAQAAKSGLHEGLGKKDKWMWPLEKFTEMKQVWERGGGKLNSTLD